MNTGDKIKSGSDYQPQTRATDVFAHHRSRVTDSLMDIQESVDVLRTEVQSLESFLMDLENRISATREDQDLGNAGLDSHREEFNNDELHVVNERLDFLRNRVQRLEDFVLNNTTKINSKGSCQHDVLIANRLVANRDPKKQYGYHCSACGAEQVAYGCFNLDNET